MMIVPARRNYPQELRDRAVRLVHEARKEGPVLSLNAAVVRIGQRVGVNPDTLRRWTTHAQVDAGIGPGVTTGDAARMKDLETEVNELKRANAMAASSFSARELDPRLP